jgi:hypothetical protein
MQLTQDPVTKENLPRYFQDVDTCAASLDQGECAHLVARTPEERVACLERYGVAIVPNVLSASECARLVSGVWSMAEHMTQTQPTPMDRARPETWKQGFQSFYGLHNMLLQHWGVGQAQALWDVRQHPKVVQVFADLYRVSPEELVVSMDGVSLAMPPEVTNQGWVEKKQRPFAYHTDQALHVRGRTTVQSWVTGLSVKEGDATLAVLEGSHRFHAKLGEWLEQRDELEVDVDPAVRRKRAEVFREPFYVVPTEDADRLQDPRFGCVARRVVCPAGCLVMWDSRVLHCGSEASRARQSRCATSRCDPSGRVVVYACYLPRALGLTEAERAQRLQWFREGRTTAHSPFTYVPAGSCARKPIGLKAFAQKARRRGAPASWYPELVPPPRPVLTPLGRSLLGLRAEEPLCLDAPARTEDPEEEGVPCKRVKWVP